MSKIIQVMKKSFLTNLFLSIMKIVVGFFGMSSALVADGLHSFSDLITDAVAIFGISISEKPADEKHPYGYGEAEYISSFIMGLIIIALGLGILFNLSNNELEKPRIIVIVISIIAIIVKFVLLKYLIKKGKEYNDIVLLSSGKESKADELSAVIVLITSILSQYSNHINVLKYADIVGSVLVSILIIMTGLKIFIDSISMILGEQETNKEIIEKIKKIILSNINIKEVDQLIVLKYGPYYKVTAEVSMNGYITLDEAYVVIAQIEKKLKKSKLKTKYINIDITPYKISN